jgi:hypothetical protein
MRSVPILLGAAGVALLATVLGTVLLAPETTEAQVPELVQLAQQRLASAQRLYMLMPIGSTGDGGGPRRPVALRYDLDRMKLALDTHRFRYLYADGVATWHHSNFHYLPEQPLPLLEPILAELLEELDAGLANSEWIREEPPDQFDRPPSEWYRVDLPFTWDDPYRIYFDLNPLVENVFEYLVVYHRDLDEVVILQHPPATGRGGYRYAARTVFHWAHWNPDFSTSVRGFPADPFEDRQYLEFTLREVEYEGGPEEPETPY